jgi:hypothetical protein
VSPATFVRRTGHYEFNYLFSSGTNICQRAIETETDKTPIKNDTLGLSVSISRKINAKKNGDIDRNEGIYGTPTFLLHSEQVAGKPGPKKALRNELIPSSLQCGQI